MRITNNMISKNLFANVSRARERMADLQTDIATSKKLREPSDDPSGYFRATNFKLLISKNEQYLKNINQISDRNTETIAALDTAVTILTNAKELAVQGASETLDAQARESLAKNIDQMLESLLSVGNTKYNGKFIFGGTQTIGTPPFSRESGTIEYQGNNSTIKNKIGEGVEVAVNKPGTQVFTTDDGVDIFNSLLELKQALEQNDTPAIQNSIGTLDKGIKHLLGVTADFAALQNRVELTEELLQSQNIDLTAFVSQIEDTDLLEATIRFQDAENAYTAGLRAFSELIQTSLMNFIG
jgi:flagellar hook-associated protein 3 FlgL